MRFVTASAAAALAVLPAALAQTFTDCDPTAKSCPADTGLDAANFESDFTKGSSAFSSWSAAQGTSLSYGSDGAEFTISKAGQAPTVQTDFYIFFGKVEVTMRAAPGTGIVSSIVLESDDLDEIDWEFLGGNTAQVETNYFGKGNTSVYDRAVYYSVATPQDTFHTYTIDWTSSQIQWMIDGTVVRTLAYDDANGGANFPQTPMVLKLGNWAGGAEGQPNGTVEWAGGKTDFSKSPFTMYVKGVIVTNYNPSESYTYGDKSGSYQSIKLGKSSSGSNSTSGTTTSTTASLASTAVSNKTVTTAPTSDASVAAINHNTGAAVSITSIGSAYSTNTASASALNANGTAMIASTQVPGAEPTATGTATGSSGSGSGTSGATSLNAVALMSLITVALAFFML